MPVLSTFLKLPQVCDTWHGVHVATCVLQQASFSRSDCEVSFVLLMALSGWLLVSVGRGKGMWLQPESSLLQALLCCRLCMRYTFTRFVQSFFGGYTTRANGRLLSFPCRHSLHCGEGSTRYVKCMSMWHNFCAVWKFDGVCCPLMWRHCLRHLIKRIGVLKFRNMKWEFDVRVCFNAPKPVLGWKLLHDFVIWTFHLTPITEKSRAELLCTVYTAEREKKGWNC